MTAYQPGSTLSGMDTNTTTKATPVRVIATDRREDEPCEAGTPGCCIDHRNDTQDSCDTW